MILQKSIDLINIYKEIVIEKIDELVNTEEAYIRTESEKIRIKFKEIGSIENCSVDNIKNIIYIYFDTIIDTFKNHIPKIIMLNMIKNVENNLSHILTKDIDNDIIITLLQEDNTIHNKRVKLLN